MPKEKKKLFGFARSHYYTTDNASLVVRQTTVCEGTLERRLLEEFLERDVGLLPVDMLRFAVSDKCVVFAAELDKTGIAGFIVVNQSKLDQGATGIVWVSVTFCQRGRHIGRTLVSHAVRYSAMIGASTIEVTRGNATRMFTRMKFVSPLQETIVVVTRKLALCLKLPKPNELCPCVPQGVAGGEIKFRRAESKDKRSCSELVLETSRYKIGAGNSLREILGAEFQVVAEDLHFGIVGFVAVQANGWVDFVAVSPKLQNRGLGSFLLFLALEWLRCRGQIYARLSPLNCRAGEFYRRWNFEVEKSCRSSGQVMCRRLDLHVPLLGSKKSLSDFLGDIPLLPILDLEFTSRKRARSLSD